MEAAAICREHTNTQLDLPRILIADDQPHILVALEMLLRSSGFATEVVTDPGRVLGEIDTEQFDAVLMDLNYRRGSVGGEEGLRLVSQIRSADSLLPVIVMTAWSSVDLAVEAMRRGASDFIQKPWENRELLQKLQSQISLARQQRRARRIHDEEMRGARAVQDELLPKRLPEGAGDDNAALPPALEFCGGGYFNVLRHGGRV